MAALKNSLVTIAIGSNVGDRAGHIGMALRLIAEQLGPIVACSALYETPPWGDLNQDFYYNAVTQVQSSRSPESVLSTLQNIEIAVGRTPTHKWGPREIDLDILLMGDLTINSTNLIIPHPFLHERVFVLLPLAEINPHYQLALNALPDIDKANIRNAGRINWQDKRYCFIPSDG
jgi:2-amino-4-hydroxy-6-hydroxymethyldihydropteridine diphosphokinase